MKSAASEDWEVGEPAGIGLSAAQIKERSIALPIRLADKPIVSIPIPAMDRQKRKRPTII